MFIDKNAQYKNSSYFKVSLKSSFFFICPLFWLFLSATFSAKKSQIGVSVKKLLEFLFNLEHFEFGFLKSFDRNKLLVNFSSIFHFFLSRTILVVLISYSLKLVTSC